MKTTRFVLFVTLILAIGLSAVSNAEAQGRQGKYAYIPLVTAESLSSKSFADQALKEYYRLLPALLDAKSQGKILEIHPVINMGLLAVKYAPGSEINEAIGAKTFGDSASALANVSTPIGPQPLATGPYYIFQLQSPCFQGYSQGSGRRVALAWATNSGTVLGVWEGYANASGYVSACLWDETDTVAAPGNRLIVKRYNGDTLLSTYATYVPKLTIDHFALNSTSGKGLASKSVTVTRYHDKLNAGNTTLVQSVTTNVGPDGNWTATFPAPRLYNGDYFAARMKQDLKFSYEYYQQVPNTVIGLGTNTIGYNGLPLQEVKIDFWHGTKFASETGNADEQGWYEAVFVNSGVPVIVTAGDRVSATNVSQYTVPQFTATLNPSTDTITGKTQPKTWFYITLKVGNSYYSDWVRADLNGNYTADFSAVYDITPTTYATVYLGLTDPKTRSYLWSRLLFYP